MNLRLVMEYDGTAFHGWQAQPEPVRTVAGELSRALAVVTGETPRLAAAGRTDAGAHSLGQTVSFELLNEIDPQRLVDSLNGVLPPDMAVLQAEVAEPGFHARFSARRRTYRYLVENRAPRAALLRTRAWHVDRELDTRAMRAAAGLLVGRRDLAAFGTDPGGRNTVRSLDSIRIRRLRAAGQNVLSFELAADAFLYGMVRRIVGFLVEVGLGRRTAADARELLSAGSSARPSRVAPAHGLYQMGVEY